MSSERRMGSQRAWQTCRRKRQHGGEALCADQAAILQGRDQHQLRRKGSAVRAPEERLSRLVKHLEVA
jgi:hypothetical protein